MAGGWCWVGFKVPSNLRPSMILRSNLFWPVYSTQVLITKEVARMERTLD